MNIKSIIAPVAVLFLGAGIGWADSISPNSVSATLNVGDSLTIHKTVTVAAGTPTTSKVDVYFLADTTGSMGSAIGAVRTSASYILSAVAGLGDVAFGVGEYKDFDGDPYAYRLNSAIQTGSAAAQTGINMWSASGGADYQEADLYALNQVASVATGWRAGSTRILVWFGDASGHDPSGGVTEATATASLVTMNIKVEALDVGTMNDTGQASRIATATGGTYYSGIDSSSIVATIVAAINSSFANYSKVGLDLSGLPAGVTGTVTPDITGTFDRSVDRTFNFDVTLTGVTAGDYNFSINGLVDGGIVAVESDSISVKDTSGPSVPDAGSSLLLLGLAATGLTLFRRKLA